MEATLRGEDRIRADAADRQQVAAGGMEPLNTHTPPSAPSLIHVAEAKRELRRIRITERRLQMDERVRRCGRILSRTCAIQEIQPVRQQIDHITGRPTGETTGEPLGSAKRSLYAVDVFDASEDREPVRGIPKALSSHDLQIPLFVARPVLPFDDGANSSQLCLEEMHDLGPAVGSQYELLEAELSVRDRGMCLAVVGVGIDEHHLDAVLTRRDEQEPLTLWEGLRDDRGRERCEQIPLHRTLERARPELRAESLLGEKLQRRLVPLDRPRAIPETTAVEYLSELALQ